MTKKKIFPKLLLFLAMVMAVILFCIWGVLCLIQLPFEWLLAGICDSGMEYLEELYGDAGPK